MKHLMIYIKLKLPAENCRIYSKYRKRGCSRRGLFRVYTKQDFDSRQKRKAEVVADTVIQASQGRT